MDSEEVKRIVAESYRGQHISSLTLCARCLYNLRGLPFDGQCPECGHRYNAVPLIMEGIFVLKKTNPPIATLVGAIVFGVCTLWAVRQTLTPFSPGMVPVTLILGVGTAHFILLTYRKFREYLVYRRGLGHLESDEFDG